MLYFDFCYLEMSDNSFTSTSASQSVTPPSGPASGSSIHSHVPDSKEWERGAPEHLHPEQSASSGSPTRTSSSMASSSPSVSSMTSSPRHSPSLIPTNGHKGSRSPMRQSPASKSFLPPAQAQMPGFTSHSLHHHRDLQVPDNVLHLDKENLSVHSNTHLPEGKCCDFASKFKSYIKCSRIVFFVWLALHEIELSEFFSTLRSFF